MKCACGVWELEEDSNAFFDVHTNELHGLSGVVENCHPLSEGDSVEDTFTAHEIGVIERINSHIASLDESMAEIDRLIGSEDV